MHRFITLASLAHLPVPTDRPAVDYDPCTIEAARDALVGRQLTFDNATGRISERGRIVERYVRPAEFTPHTCEADVMEWEFSRYIRNSASRITRGFEA